MPKILNTEKVIADFKKIHGNRYDYSRVIYINCTKRIKIVCKKHGEFKITATYHKYGFGCHKCRIYGINK